MNTENTNNFFGDDNYQVPETSNYMKLKLPENKFRALSSAIVGFEYFKNDNRVVRSREMFDETPDIKDNVTHFWAFVVYNYTVKRIQILEINKKTIQDQMKAYISNPDWGDPKGYDITIKRVGTTKNDTKYSVMPSPHKELDKSIKDKFELMKIDLNALYEGNDPFTVDKQE